MRLDRNIDKVTTGYEVGQSVEIWIAARTDLGFKAIVNGRNWGVLFANEIFKPLRYGQKLQGFIKNVREDGKLDLSLSKTGHQGAENIGSQILELLKKHGGFVEITDKTPPETIYSLFGVSKKKYKIALGGLYRDRKILVEEGGIRLVEAPGKN